MGEYANPEVLISVEWLSEHLDDPNVRIVEVDEDTTAYSVNHIPNAVGWNWREDLHAKPRRDYLDQDGLNDLLQRSGVGPETTLALYGGNNNWFAAYAYWIVRLRGFDQVKLVDGGRKLWELQGRPLTEEVPSFPRTSFTISNPDRPEIRAFRDDVLARLGTVDLVDVRSPEEFRGEMMAPAHLLQESAMVVGHIPGATNVPWSRAVHEDGTFKPADALTELYHEAGVDPNGPVIAYCRIGERSAHTWFVLHELLGYSDVANYDGSWTEYGSLVGAPVEL